MKKTIMFALGLAVTASVYGQGQLIFDNYDINGGVPAPVTIGGTNAGAAEGAAGANIGSTYSAALYYLNGTVAPGAFDSSSPILAAISLSSFIGTTGGSPTTDGAGLFAYTGGPQGSALLTIPTAGDTSGKVTVEVRAWWNNGGAVTSYDQALAAGYNVGESAAFGLTLATGTVLPNTIDGFTSFTVGATPTVTPEPATLALCGLGAASLLLFRRKKK